MNYADRKVIGGKPHPGGDYKPVVVEIYRETKSGKGADKHVRPVIGQPFSQDLDVQFDEATKEASDVGTRFLIWGKLSQRKNGGYYVNSSWRWAPEEI